jgi:hypothetical protein
MKILLIGAVACSRELVSFDAVVALTSETIGWLKDASLYIHDKALEYIPAEHRQKYQEYMELGAAELGKAQAQVVAAVSPSVEIVTEAVSHIYQVADKRTSSVVNTVLVDFERRYPNEAGKIGASLLDRVVFVIYLYLFAKGLSCICKMLWRAISGKAKKIGSVKVGEPVVKEFRISEVASAPPRPSFPSKTGNKP